MASFAIVWRNPKLAPKQWRLRQLEKNTARAVYVVEELNATKVNGWTIASAFEVVSRKITASEVKAPEWKWFGFGR